MRILVDPGSIHCLNMGDVAMMQVTVQRLQARWPSADIHVLTEAPDRLRLYCPGVRPASAKGRAALYTTAAILPRLGYRVPAIAPLMSSLDVAWRQKYPGMASRIADHRLRIRGQSARSVDLLKLLDSCDLLVVSGAGQMTTAFEGSATLVLNTLEAAIQRGIPTVLFGQGMGPIGDSALLMRARKVLPRVNLIGLRERLTAPKLLDSIGVPKEKYTVTGDDAIELAYRERRSEPGAAIGLNLRLASYAGIDDCVSAAIRPVIAGVAKDLGAPLVHVPISRHSHESEQGVFDYLADGSRVWQPVNDTSFPCGVVREIGRCRVVVTSSYHGGVFALSQGIPVVACVSSAYYATKMSGLACEFGEGCMVVPLNQPDTAPRVRDAIVGAWNRTESLRTQLLTAAEKQIRNGQALYDRACELATRSQ